MSLLSPTDVEPQPPRLHRRNVEVFHSEGSEVIAGFWQYGTLQWDEFYKYISSFILATTTWTIFQYDPAQQQHGAACPSSTQIVQPGHYILLSETGGSNRVGLLASLPRPRNPTHSNTPVHEPEYCIRGRNRDGKCVITDLQTQTHSRLKVTHIFPWVHNEWIRQGYPSKITDTADEASMGGSTKIDSVQNVVTIRSYLQDAWDNYEFGVDPNNNYRITAFTSDIEDINVRSLHLDHIQDPTLHPLDELFADHFRQGVLKYMKGTGEPAWTDEDIEDAFGDGQCDLSNPKIWDTREGKKLYELMLADRLFDHRISTGSL